MDFGPIFEIFSQFPNKYAPPAARRTWPRLYQPAVCAHDRTRPVPGVFGPFPPRLVAKNANSARFLTGLRLETQSCS